MTDPFWIVPLAWGLSFPKIMQPARCASWTRPRSDRLTWPDQTHVWVCGLIFGFLQSIFNLKIGRNLQSENWSQLQCEFRLNCKSGKRWVWSRWDILKCHMNMGVTWANWLQLVLGHGYWNSDTWPWWVEVKFGKSLGWPFWIWLGLQNPSWSTWVVPILWSYFMWGIYEWPLLLCQNLSFESPKFSLSLPFEISRMTCSKVVNI